MNEDNDWAKLFGDILKTEPPPKNASTEEFLRYMEKLIREGRVNKGAV